MYKFNKAIYKITKSKSSSVEQQSIEKYLLDTINKKYGLSLKSTKLDLQDGVQVQLDGYNKQNNAICEIYAHVGPLKGSQPNKVASDF